MLIDGMSLNDVFFKTCVNCEAKEECSLIDAVEEILACKMVSMCLIMNEELGILVGDECIDIDYAVYHLTKGDPLEADSFS